MASFSARSSESDAQQDLLARIDQFGRDFRLLSLSELGRRAEAIRRIAADMHIGPAESQARHLADALVREGRAAPVGDLVAALRDAATLH